MTNSKKSEFVRERSYWVLAVFCLVILGITFWLYAQVQDLFKANLQSRILSIVSTASVQFEHDELSAIQGTNAVGTKNYYEVINKLNRIRDANENLKYIYILRKTGDEDIFQFVADADSLDPSAEIDLNGDGAIDDSDALNTPGDEYDVSEFEELKQNAFIKPTVDQDLTIDQWGVFMSASAPIPNDQGVSKEMIGIDVDVSDFRQLTNLALIPFLVFIGLLLVAVILLAGGLIKMWSSRVHLLGELDRQKDELLSIVSHQLAAPVTAIKWYLESILDDGQNLKDEQKTDMKSMQSITEDLSDLVSMILDVSRIQLGKMRVDPQSLDLQVFFADILGVIEPKAKEKPVNLVKSLPDKLPVALLDKRLTRMTVENLLTNAVKYTPKDGNVWFTVTIDAKDVLSITVKDTGVGIPKADQGKIFGKQFRASNVRNAIDGNGFGLYVAKGAIEGQDGKIWFESEEGKGTTFFVQVPLKFPKEETKP